MIEVHAPEEAIHSWRDFATHIATIVVGLLIAVGLEQTVELIHHREQLHALREALQHDNEKALHDDEDMERSARNEITWLSARIDDVTAAMHGNTAAHYIPHDHVEIYAFPAEPAWKAARASNLVEVMPPEEVPAFDEVDLLIQGLNTRYYNTEPSARRSAFEQQFRVSPSSMTLDYSKATHADLAQDLTLLAEERDNARNLYSYTLWLRGCLSAMNRGERDLDKLDTEENKTEDPYWSLTHRDDVTNQKLREK